MLTSLDKWEWISWHKMQNYVNFFILHWLPSTQVLGPVITFHQVVELMIWIKLLSNADKPPLSDLPYFLDYQAHRLWAPIHNDLPLGPVSNRTTHSPSLSLNLMGPKLYVNTAKVLSNPFPLVIRLWFHVLMP